MARLQAARRLTATGHEPDETMVPAGPTALGKDSERFGTRRPVRRASPPVEVGPEQMLGAGRAHVSGSPGLRRHSSMPGAESIKAGMCA